MDAKIIEASRLWLDSLRSAPREQWLALLLHGPAYVEHLIEYAVQLEAKALASPVIIGTPIEAPPSQRPATRPTSKMRVAKTTSADLHRQRVGLALQQALDETFSEIVDTDDVIP